MVKKWKFLHLSSFSCHAPFSSSSQTFHLLLALVSPYVSVIGPSPSSTLITSCTRLTSLTLQSYLRHLELPEHYETSRAFHAVGAAIMELLLVEAKVRESVYWTRLSIVWFSVAWIWYFISRILNNWIMATELFILCFSRPFSFTLFVPVPFHTLVYPSTYFSTYIWWAPEVWVQTCMNSEVHDFEVHAARKKTLTAYFRAHCSYLSTHQLFSSPPHSSRLQNPSM